MFDLSDGSVDRVTNSSIKPLVVIVISGAGIISHGHYRQINILIIVTMNFKT